jgi:hypothetical protein
MYLPNKLLTLESLVLAPLRCIGEDCWWFGVYRHQRMGFAPGTVFLSDILTCEWLKPAPGFLGAVVASGRMAAPGQFTGPEK